MGIKLIYCAGGNPNFAKTAVDCGWLYGSRLPSTVYQKVFFADQDWKNPDRNKYMLELAKHRPNMSTVLDLEHENQFEEVISWAKEASEYVENIVIIPKVSGIIKLIPEKVGESNVILGYSVRTSYGGTDVPVWEFCRRPVHLLGGSPQSQMELFDYMNVVSADGNMVIKQANCCRTWVRKKAEKGHWVQLSSLGDLRKNGANLECFRLSLLEIKKAWEMKLGCKINHETSTLIP